jgi:uncharacterized protein
VFVKDARLRPIWRVLVFAIAVPTMSWSLWRVYDWLATTLQWQTSWLEDMAASDFATALSVLVLALWLRRHLDRRSQASLGFSLSAPWLRLFALGIAFGAGMQAIAYAVEAATGDARVVGYGSFRGDMGLLVIAALLLLPAAFSEEMSFRGYLLQNFCEEFGMIPAIAITSLAFALVHSTNPHAREQWALTIIGLLTYAVWASLSLVWTKSLWLAFGAHVAWNLFEGPVFGLPLSGVQMPAQTVLVQSVHGPTWLTGGAFGPEAGVSSIIALGVGFVVLRVLYVKGAFG